MSLVCVATMKFHQRTGFSDSVSYFGGPYVLIKICGLGQGSGGAPGGWKQLSSMFVNMYKALGDKAHVMNNISQASDYSIGYLFVDDTELYFS